MEVYNEITNALNSITYLVLFFGDFIPIIDISEKKNQNYDSVGKRNSKSWIEILDVVDIMLQGRAYSW